MPTTVRVSKKAKKQPPASNVTPPNCDESSSDSDSESSGDVQDIAEGSDVQSGHAAGTSRQTPSNSNSELEAGPSEEHGNAEVTKLASRPITIQTATRNSPGRVEIDGHVFLGHNFNITSSENSGRVRRTVESISIDERKTTTVIENGVKVDERSIGVEDFDLFPASDDEQ